MSIPTVPKTKAMDYITTPTPLLRMPNLPSE
ncbi:hypothetical protein COLO4_03285 [Corchorus olitorius]|uniref:Uncharacterized protein n=1 Tax=Corchorus olitorius TaxID=93759 RepID=A0A1R3KCL3_9ROSI|nr:hypothetical protein COLO4_09258 [Corchorus olitorius]OMP12359.1 hypothetical protein COLO4_03285 [Corchorus olitorius]